MHLRVTHPLLAAAVGLPARLVDRARRLLLLLALMMGVSAVVSADTLMLDPAQERQPLNQGLAYLVEQQPMTIGQLLRVPADQWTPLEEGANFGYTDRGYWYRLRLRNPTEQPIERLLEIAYPLLDHVEFYDVSDGQLRVSHVTGDTKRFSQRPITDRNFVFPLELAAGAQHDIYLRVKTAGAQQLPLNLWEERAFHRASAAGLVGRAMFYGMLLVMAAYNLFLYFSLRERAYLYYVLVIVSTYVLMGSLHGFNFQYLYPNLPWLHEMVILLAVPLCQIVLCLFTMEFLSLSSKRPGWHKLFRVLIGLAGLCVIGALVLPYSLSTRLSVFLALPVCIAALSVGLVMWWSGEKSARFFCMAWIFLLGGIMITVLNKAGVLPTVFITEHGIPLGSSLEALLLSFALADRFNREREARDRAQRTSLEALRHQQQAEERLVYASSHNALSGLPNRVIFERTIENLLPELETHQDCLGVVLLHLRHFDDVNKTLGHQNADTLIVRVAERMNTLAGTRSGAVQIEQEKQQRHYAAHVEGVTFACALRGADQHAVITQIEDIAQGMARPIEFMGLALDLGLVIGCAFAPGDDLDAQTLLRQAFIAFDQSDLDANGIAIYAPDMNPYSPRRLTLMTELRHAIEQDLLELYFQPQIHLAQRRVAGFEALLRWNHPDYGFIPPDEFIPMAEQTGLIKPLTRWVISHALEFCRDLGALGCDAHVAVNISAANLRERGFCDQVCALLDAHAVDAQRLVLEVTETAAMIDPKSALAVLRALQAARVRLSIDDFGTGHSSLSYIRKLPVQEIKIDRSFVMEMDVNRDDATIVRTTVNMCHDLGYEVVAEGVENASTCDLLSELGCDFVQGYHIARPMNRQAALDWLSNTNWQIRSAGGSLETDLV